MSLMARALQFMLMLICVINNSFSEETRPEAKNELGFLRDDTEQVARTAKTHPFNPKHVIVKVVDLAKQTQVGTPFHFDFDFSRLPIANTGLGAEPSYGFGRSLQMKGFLRTDSYIIPIDFNLGDLFPALPLYFNIKKGEQLRFIRSFPSSDKALSALPFSPIFIPANSKIARKMMNKGDIFSFPSDLSITLGASAFASLGASPGLAVSVGYFLLTGAFDISVIAMTEGRFRIRLVTRTVKGIGLASYVTPLYTITGIGVVDGLIRGLFSLNLATLGLSYNHEKDLIFDYVFDLNNEKGQKAYDLLMGKALKLGKFAGMTPVGNQRYIENVFVTPLHQIDEWATEDLDLPLMEKRVIKVFNGLITSKTQAVSTSLGLIFFNFLVNQSYAHSYVHLKTSRGEEKDYFLGALSSVKSNKSFGGFYSRTELTMMRQIFVIDQKKQFVGHGTAGEFGYMNGTTMGGDDFRKFYSQVNMALPPSELAKFEWPYAWKRMLHGHVKSFKNGLFLYQHYFSPTIHQYLNDIDAKEWEALITDYIKELNKSFFHRYFVLSKLNFLKNLETRKLAEGLEGLYSKMQAKESEGIPIENYWMKKYYRLRFNPMFKVLMPGIVNYALLKKGVDLKTVSHGVFMLRSRTQPLISFSYGDKDEHKLYKILLELQLPPEIMNTDYTQLNI